MSRASGGKILSMSLSMMMLHQVQAQEKELSALGVLCSGITTGTSRSRCANVAPTMPQPSVALATSNNYDHPGLLSPCPGSHAKPEWPKMARIMIMES